MDAERLVTNSEVVESPVIFFDGVCNLCNSAVNFVIDRDTDRQFLFASLQSDFAHDKLARYEVNPSLLQSILLLKNGQLYHKSDAALEVASLLGGPWRLLSVFKIVPKFIRDFFYDWIAKNRYRWFGRQETCRVPTPDLKERFLDSY
ncbi:thiol-disulfide oxidoreductase DCC family protein [Marinoscillum sp.]|uniref:thiol-disulfide oxidoreductase DCC family protein n=1 Tax=Marinoscillum sp. TaxID=2024838 RepID=UPI003BAD569D